MANGRDPDRLFNNRGCVLLKEEKKRTKVVKVEHVEYNFNVFRAINFVNLIIGTPQGRSSNNRVAECIRTDPWAGIAN